MFNNYLVKKWIYLPQTILRLGTKFNVPNQKITLKVIIILYVRHYVIRWVSKHTLPIIYKNCYKNKLHLCVCVLKCSQMYTVIILPVLNQVTWNTSLYFSNGLNWLKILKFQVLIILLIPLYTVQTISPKDQ